VTFETAVLIWRVAVVLVAIFIVTVLILAWRSR
jgi:preprotein translocase subunit SecG